MNNQSPLVPQGSLLEQKSKSRARVKVAVFSVLAIHAIGLMALLMQGCHKEEPLVSNDPLAQTNTAPVLESTNPVTLADTNPIVPTTNPVVDATSPPVPPAAATEYIVAKGDTFSGIATAKHLTLKALTDANPGVVPTKLQIGQKLHIPAATVAPLSNAGTSSPVDASSGEAVYTVKSGDTLINIAKHHNTTVKAIRAANSLTTDSIKVGQKLKMPKPSTPSDPATAAPSGGPTPSPSAH